jgi:outer membrane protein assembly factor BamD (BamD/ComL family)/thioredoxin-like negative regulator of GroEL
MSAIGRVGVISLSILLPLVVSAQNSTQLAEATSPLTDGVPEVAAARLQELLSLNLPNDQWCAVAQKLAEAFIAAKQPADALRLLADVRLQEIPSARFWSAQALASLCRWAEALPLYDKVAADESSSFRTDAIFGAGEMLRALGRRDEALQKFLVLFRDKQWGTQARLRLAELYIDKNEAVNARRVLDEMQPNSAEERKERRFLRGRLEIILRRPERAIATFQALLKRSEGASHAVLMGALFGIADAYLQLKTPETGDDFLEDFITRHPTDPELPTLFAKLDELYREERKPSRSELERWIRNPDEPRRALARWYLARFELRAGHRERALELFGELRADRTKSPAVAVGLLEFAQLELEERRFDDAIGILERAQSLKPEAALLDRINLLAARAEYLAKRFDAATASFEQIAHSSSPWAKSSLFNASLGWLQLGDHARFLADYNEFEKQGGDEQSRAELRLEEGLVQAAKGDAKAAESLHAFVHAFPRNPRVAEAWVALAELAFRATPPDLDEARKDLAHAAGSEPTAAAAERGDYLRIWIEDSESANDVQVIELANRFLQQHPTSALAPEVRMKLAEAYYRRQDFPNAQTQFEILTQENPTGPLQEKALFFAAESAISSMAGHSLDRAIVLLDQVVRLNGDLKWAARNEQAVIERKLGKPQDALLLYEEVLKGDARPSEKREALCGKGDILFEMGGNANYRRATEVYDQLATEPGEPIHWRNQALFKKGLCLEKETYRPGALATFYKVLENEARPDQRHELFWFYKAGFNAARLLEDDSKWESAAAIYQKLAAAGGSRSEEAKARLNRLRLEHFLWEID